MKKKGVKKVSKKSSLKSISRNEEEKRLFAFLATFLSVVGFVIALVAKRKDKYVMYYAKHSLIIFVLMIIAGAIGKVFLLIPIAGDIINMALILLSLLVWVISWVYALTGKEKEIPIITTWANKIEL